MGSWGPILQATNTYLVTISKENEGKVKVKLRGSEEKKNPETYVYKKWSVLPVRDIEECRANELQERLVLGA